MTDDPNAARLSGNNRDAEHDEDETAVASVAPHDVVGAYLLDALPTAERDVFAAHVSGCGACRRSVADLAPVVAILPRLLEVAPEDRRWVAGGNGGAPPPAPSADLRGRILTAAAADAERGAAPVLAPVGMGGVETPGSRPVDPPGWDRMAPNPVVETSTRGARVVPFRGRARFGGGWPVAAALTLVAAGAVVWALATQGRIADQNERLAAQRDEIEEMRSANALAFAMAPTADGPSGASGNLLYAPGDGLAMLHVAGLPALAEGRAYQLWMLKGTEPIPSETFAVGAGGDASMAMEADLSGYDAVALTVEPVGGSPLPTTSPILLGEMARAG